jgi:hypothetical protein
MIRFKSIGLAVEKISRREFVIQDSVTKCDLDLLYWVGRLVPGQRVEMSMIFLRTTPIDNKCPNCGASSPLLPKRKNFEW